MESAKGEPRVRFRKPNWGGHTQGEGEYHEVNEERNSFNNTTVTYNQYADLSISNQRRRLPIFNYRNHILYMLEKHNVLIVVGETGSGKSTQVPQYLLEAGWAGNGHLIGVTQPRRVAVTTVASR